MVKSSGSFRSLLNPSPCALHAYAGIKYRFGLA